MNELVSIIMPSYNCAEYIEESIRCVLAQTYPVWELIIIDDGSTDDSVARVTALKATDGRIALYRNERNEGPAYTRNRALRMAKGRWIAFLDSDDLWEPEKLERQIRFMEEHGYAFTYTCYQEIDIQSRPTGVMVSGPKHITHWGMLKYDWVGCLTVMYDQHRVGLVQIARMKRLNDYAMWLKVIRKADCYLLDECLSRYRSDRQGSVSNQGYLTLVVWHYRLFREAEGMGRLASLFLTGVNIVFGIYKKLWYVKRSKI